MHLLRPVCTCGRPFVALRSDLRTRARHLCMRSSHLAAWARDLARRSSDLRLLRSFCFTLSSHLCRLRSDVVGRRARVRRVISRLRSLLSDVVRLRSDVCEVAKSFVQTARSSSHVCEPPSARAQRSLSLCKASSRLAFGIVAAERPSMNAPRVPWTGCHRSSSVIRLMQFSSMPPPAAHGSCDEPWRSTHAVLPTPRPPWRRVAAQARPPPPPSQWPAQPAMPDV